ncbi:MAG: hypothetical protein L3J44_00180 [Campylobacteraceae bacterium]|nr:hypothetical protein [Campylobacteraceae bacterium]
MKKTLFEKNIINISKLFKSNEFYILSSYYKYKTADNSIDKIYKLCQEKRYIAQSLNIYNFIGKLVELNIIKNYILSIGSKNISFYSKTDNNSNLHYFSESDMIKIIDTVFTEGFFSMTTALYIQGFARYKTQLIFHSKELTKKDIHLSSSNISLSQKNIVESYKNKNYRYTNNIGSFDKYHIISLSPKNTNNFGVIKYGEYPVSSIERALVEMVVNVHYFKSFNNLISIFKPIKNRINIKNVADILIAFDFIYPYYNSVGFLLEEIGFKKGELTSIRKNINTLDFYTERKKETYRYNKYWKIYY